MKNSISKLAFSEKARKTITFIIYIIFAIFTISNLIKEPSIVGKLCYLFILLLFLGIAGWAEYLRYLYHKMIEALGMQCNPEKAMYYYHDLKKKDFFKSYKQTLLVFDTLYYQDINKPEEAINLLNEHEKTFKSSLDYLLIRNYTYFISYYQLGNHTKVKKYFPEVMKMKDKKIKGSKVSPLYNWTLIEAIYLLSTKDYKKSVQAFKNVNTKNMNHRELALYYNEFGKAYLQLHDKENAIIMFTKAIELGNKLYYSNEAKTYVSKI